MRIVRGFSLKAGRNSTIFVIGIFLSIILTAVFFANYNGGEFGSRPVHQDIFGEFFVITHLALMGVVILSVITGIVLHRMGIIRHFNHYLISIEKTTFRNRYNFNVGPLLSKSKRNRAIFIMLGSTTFPLLFSLLAQRLLQWDDLATGFAISGGIVLMFVVFYGQVAKFMRKGNQSMQSFLNKINNLCDNTNLVVDGTDQHYTLGSVKYTSVIRGMYKGYNLKMNSQSNGQQKGGKTIVHAEISLQILSGNNHTFIVKEKNPAWTILQGKNLDECFNQRFKLEGINIKDLSDKFKKTILLWNRNINLNIDKEKTSYFLMNDPVLPYYTPEGLILFLDFVINLVQNLGTIDS